MCGIIAYLGGRPASEVLLNGLQRLEYRGYDSAGLATLNGAGLQIRRAVGQVECLTRCVADQPVSGTIGIAHTRWATHGRPTEANAHPQVDQHRRIALVHNGVLENHTLLRKFLEGLGVQFASETDTEVLAQLIGYYYEDSHDLTLAVRNALQKVKGTFGIVAMCVDQPDLLVGALRASPLILGIANKDLLLASDPSALAGVASEVIYLSDNEVVTLSRDNGFRIDHINGASITRSRDRLDIAVEALDLKGYEHHMLKEIREQPQSLRMTMQGRIDTEQGNIRLGGLAESERLLPRCRRLLIFGCGTAWHAALIGKYLFEELAGIPVDVEYSSELRYRNPIIEDGTLSIAISQSGETADTLAALREVQMRGATVLGVVNTVGSSIARETDAGVYLHVGPEIGVASTKAFTAQVAVLVMMATHLGRRRHLSQGTIRQVIDELAEIPEKVERALAVENQVAVLARRLADWDNWLYLGRGVNFPVALEGALKLKEVSYIHAEGLPAAEMKHGPIALIDAGTPVIVVAPGDHTHSKILANIEEVRSRDGQVIAIATEGDFEIADVANEVLYVPETHPLLSPLVTTIPLQLLAYHTALARGRDVDKPRNMAKSVTVE